MRQDMEVAATPHGHAGLGKETPQSTFYDQGRFGRLFPTLPLRARYDAHTGLAHRTRSGGRADDADDGLSDPITLITDPAKSLNNPDNPALTAGFTFLGHVVVGDVKAELGPGFTPGEIFEEAQRVVRWHYQWLIHSQVRPNYRANFGTSASDPTQQFFALIFDPAATDPDDPADLRGGRRARAVSSTGIPSSTSATAGYAPTRRSTRSSRRSSST